MGFVELHGGCGRERAVRDVFAPHVCADAAPVHLTDVCAELQPNIITYLCAECVPYARSEHEPDARPKHLPDLKPHVIAVRVTVGVHLGPFGLADELTYFIANVVPICKPFSVADRESIGNNRGADCISNCLPEYFTFRKSLMGSHGSNVPKRGEGRW